MTVTIFKKAQLYTIQFRYSQRIIWLKAASSNNDPYYIARNYFDSVRRENGKSIFTPLNFFPVSLHVGCPRVLRTDRGTENSLLAVIQPVLRHYHGDSLAQEKSH